MFDEHKHHDTAVYAGYLSDDEKLIQSASGGIATALAERMLELGGFVAGVAYSEDFYRAEYILIHDKSELGKLKGSKYIECEKGTIYSDIKRLLDSGEKVLFFGLPCAVAALYRFVGDRPENLLTCELICQGPTSPKIHQEYMARLEDKYQSKIVDFSVRYKKKGWTPPYLYAKFENGKVFEKKFYETEYGYAFSVFGGESCYSCKFRGNDRQGDIMIGDFWGATGRDDFWNRNGVSVIFAETKKGNDFLSFVEGVKLFPTTFEKAVEKNPMVIRPRQREPEREKFSKLLSEKGLFYAAKHSAGIKKRVINTAAKMIPDGLRPAAEKIYHAVFGS